MSYEKENKKAEKINKQGLWENVGLKPNLQSKVTFDRYITELEKKFPMKAGLKIK